MELPFVVVHGWWIAKLLVAICGGFGLGAVVVVRWFRERGAVKAQLAERFAKVSAPAEGDVYVVGNYRERDGQRWIDGRDRGERVTLDGEVDVLLGTEVEWRSRSQDALGIDRPLRRVADGDEVIARGPTTSEADASADAAASYRTAAGVYVMRGTVVRPIEITATRPAIRPQPLGWTRIAGYVALSALVGYGALRATGKQLAKHDYEHAKLRTVTSLDGYTSLFIASALPGSRKRALDRLHSILDHEAVNTPAVWRLRVAITELVDGCRGKVRVLADASRYEEMLAAADACGDRRGAFTARLVLGRYADAAAHATPESPARDRVLAFVGSGRWADAARAVDEIVAQHEQASEADSDTRTQDAICIATWFRALGGDAGARTKARQRDTANAPGCAIVRVLAMDRGEQRAMLETLDVGSGFEYREIVDDLRFLAGLDQDESDAIRAAAQAMLGYSFSEDQWLAALSDAQTPSFHALRAVHAMYRGDWQSADASIDRAEATAPTTAISEQDVARLRVALEIRRGDRTLSTTAEQPWPLRDLVEMRQGRIPDDDRARLSALEAGCAPHVRPALEAAANGDGTQLAAYFERCRVHWFGTAPELIALLPRVTNARERLAATLRLHGQWFGYSTRQLPFHFVGEIAQRRDVARLAGDEAEAKRWQSIIDAHVATLADRDRLLALRLAWIL